MVKVPLSVFVIRTSKKASLLSCSSSLVNLMFLVVLLMVSRIVNCFVLFDSSKYIVYIPVPCFNVVIVCNSFTFQILHHCLSKETGKWRPHRSARDLSVVIVLNSSLLRRGYLFYRIYYLEILY